MDEKALSIVLQARDEATKTLNEVNKAILALGDGTDTLHKKSFDLGKFMKDSFNNALIISGAAVAALSAEAFIAVKAFSEAEKADKQLEHAVLNVTHATKEQLKQTEALADALEAKGVLDGDNIKIGLAQLSTFGLSNKAVQGLSGSLADLAVNQFGVNASGDQLSQTANMIAKALNNQFGVLEKSGIRFTEAQKSIIKYGDEMEKVKAINEGFAQNLKYTNDVALKTTEGAMAKMNVAIENIHESIGGLIARALIPLAPKISEVANVLSSVIDGTVRWDDAISTLDRNMGYAGVVLGQTIQFFYENKDAATALGYAVGGFLAVSITAATVAMAGFVLTSLPVAGIAMAAGAAIAYVVTHLDEVKAALREVSPLAYELGSAIFSIASQIPDFIMKLDQNTYAHRQAEQAVRDQKLAIEELKAIQEQEKDMSMQLEGAQLQLERATRNVSETTKIYGENSLEAKEARFRLKETEERVRDVVEEVNKKFDEHSDKIKKNMELAKPHHDTIDATTKKLKDQKNEWQGIIDKIGGVIGKIGEYADKVSKATGGAVGIGLPNMHFADGGPVPRTGLAMVHAGEYVLSKDMLAGRQPIQAPISYNNQRNASVSIGQVVFNSEFDAETFGSRLAWQLANSR